MNWTEDLKKFQDQHHNPPSLEKWDYFLRNKFNIQMNFKANILYRGFFKIIGDYDYTRENEKGNTIFSENNYMVIFPNDGIRINCTKNFIEFVTLLDNIFNKKWKEQPYSIRYYDHKLKRVIKGPHVYISTCNLDMYIYNKENENCRGKTNILESILEITSKDHF